MTQELRAARIETADREFEQFDFWGATVAATSGWEDDGLDTLKRNVFFEAANPAADTVPGQFTLDFEPHSAEVFNVTATRDGVEFGDRGVISPRP